MNDAALVGIIERMADLIEHFDRHLNRKRFLLFDQVAQAAAGHQFDHQIDRIFVLAVVEHLQDVWMAEGSDSPGFTLETGHEHFCAGQVGLDDLDGDIARNGFLPRAVDSCHATLAEQRNDFILAELLADQV